MLKLDQLEMQRTLRLNLVQSEPQIADIVRQSCDLDEAAWPQDQLLAHTRRGLDQAIGWNLTTQEDVIGFLVLRHQFCERFDEFPAVCKFLSRSDLPPDNRIQLMMLTLPLGTWDVVKRRTPKGLSAPTLTGTT